MDYSSLWWLWSSIWHAAGVWCGGPVGGLGQQVPLLPGQSFPHRSTLTLTCRLITRSKYKVCVLIVYSKVCCESEKENSDMKYSDYFLVLWFLKTIIQNYCCRPGHVAQGDLKIHCQANGRWSRPDGACHSKTFIYIEKCKPQKIIMAVPLRGGGGSTIKEKDFF